MTDLDLDAIEAGWKDNEPTENEVALIALCREQAEELARLREDARKRLSLGIFAVRDHDAYAQPFILMRTTDVSGVSGTGIVADGVAFPDGTVALRWRGGNPTSVVFHDNGVASVEAIHGHGGATRLVWLAEDLETTAEVAVAAARPIIEAERDEKWRNFDLIRVMLEQQEAEVRERIAADIEAHIYANPLTTQERWQASGLRAAARIARGVRHDPSATTDGGAP